MRRSVPQIAPMAVLANSRMPVLEYAVYCERVLDEYATTGTVRTLERPMAEITPVFI